MRNKGQVTVFIVVAVVLVALVAGYFLLKDSFNFISIPANVEPVYQNFLSCLEENTLLGIDVLESQGGYIEVPTFEAGSEYAPFSNQLDFLGNPVPYWYYISANGLEKEQVPTKTEMEEALASFIDGRIRDCGFDDFYAEGYEINQGEPISEVSIRGGEVVVNLKMDLSITKEEDSSTISSHKLAVNSNLGTLYDSAIKVYEKENEELFLERYTVDNLRLYAPVDGVEITCSPQIWNSQEVFDELQNAIESNTLALRTKGNDYTLKDEINKYFVIDEDFGVSVNFINSKNWPYYYEVNPSEGDLLVSLPVGNQPGLGIMGFCYVPYHYVYDVKYPVLVQTSLNEEIFQFPMAVVLDNNNPRKPLDVEAVGSQFTNLCEYSDTPVSVKTYDIGFNSVNTNISFECFGTKCDIGETINGELDGMFPQCVNGFIVAKADGFKESKYLFSTISSGNVDIILDKVYETEVNLKLGGVDYNGESIVTFKSDSDSKTIVYPEQKSVELMEGQYEVQVQIYGDSNIKFPSSKSQQCVDVPQQGFGRILGLTKERCYDIEVPGQTITQVLIGGGKQNYYILESELKSSSSITINADKVTKPTSIEEMQMNYILYDQRGLEINFR